MTLLSRCLLRVSLSVSKQLDRSTANVPPLPTRIASVGGAELRQFTTHALDHRPLLCSTAACLRVSSSSCRSAARILVPPCVLTCPVLSGVCQWRCMSGVGTGKPAGPGTNTPPSTVSTSGQFSVSPSTSIGGGASSISQQLLHEKADEEKEEQRKRESSWRAMKYTLAFLGLTASFSAGWLIVSFGAPPQDPDGNVMNDEFSSMYIVPQYLCRSWKEIKLYNKMIKDPSRDLLLPDPLQYPYHQPPYTLVLELTGVLVHPDWTYKTGWRFKKRPGISFFLQQIGPPLFEVVIYTCEQGFTAHPIVDALDPQGYVMYRLYKDSTRYMDRQHVKDLNCLNRDLSKVIMVDWNTDAVQMNPRNHLKVAKWNGDDTDRNLVDLAMLLKAIASSGVKDVREVMDHYRQYDDPLEAFRENQRILREQEASIQKQEQQMQSSPLSNVRSTLLSNFRRR